MVRTQPKSPDAYSQNLHALVERILAIDARPVLASPNPRFDHEETRFRDFELMQPYANAAASVADYYQIGWIDVYSQFMSEYDNLEQLIPDCIHPGPSGHCIIADTMAESLIPMLGGDRIRLDSRVSQPDSPTAPAHLR